ncbi:hypothetical protein QNM99_19160 [Pseudomonas sp. PCH446]
MGKNSWKYSKNFWIGEDTRAKAIICRPEMIGERLRREQLERAQFRNHYRLRNEHQELWDENALATELASAMTLLHGNRRYLLCVHNLFKPLTLSSNTKIIARDIFPHSIASSDYILLPFLFLGQAKTDGVTVESTPAQIDALCHWTQSRLIHSASIDDIRQLYCEVINFIDDKVMKPTVYWGVGSVLVALQIKGRSYVESTRKRNFNLIELAGSGFRTTICFWPIVACRYRLTGVPFSVRFSPAAAIRPSERNEWMNYLLYSAFDGTTYALCEN